LSASANNPPAPLAAIFGSSGERLTLEERAFFHDCDPVGFILFARNVVSPDQVRALVADVRDAAPGGCPLVLVDQEGGRVARLRPPHWRLPPPAVIFGGIDAVDREGAARAAYFNAVLIGNELRALGINMDCAPTLDLTIPGAHEIIGDRAYGGDPERVARLGRAACDGFLAAGVLPVIKHIPGHGRARVDSHESLPIVDTPADILRGADFAPFVALADMPAAMTAHIVYAALDPNSPATTSHAVIQRIIRGEIGFDGLLMSDDLGMKALSGDFADRTRRVLAAGCDVVLHCSGDMPEMEAVAQSCTTLSDAAQARLNGALARLTTPTAPDSAAALGELNELFSRFNVS
jgi:beta-N-acetylhexosaminidase